MACFLACFAGDSSKAQKRRREVAPPRVPAPPLSNSVRVHLQSQEIGEFSQRIVPEKPPASAVAALPDPVPRHSTGCSVPVRKEIELESFNSGRKRVTFDLNVKTYENIVSTSISEDSKYSSDEEAEMAEEDKDKENTDRDLEDGDDDIGGGEDIGIDDDVYGDSVADDGAEEESYDSYFSLPLDKNINGGGSKNFSSALVGSEEVNSSPSHFKASRGARDRSKYVHSVLNPIENSAQWKEVIEARKAPEKRPEEKENIGLAPETDPLIPCMDSKKDVAVDASLLSWLVTSAIHAI